MVSDTADQAGLRSSIPNCHCDDDDRQKQNGHCKRLHPWTAQGAIYPSPGGVPYLPRHRAQIIPPRITTGSGNNRRSSQLSFPANAAVQ